LRSSAFFYDFYPRDIIYGVRKSTAVKHTELAKISAPLPKDVVLRKRLFQQIDDCRKNPITWVSGTPGCGKTTLVSSYIHYKKIPCIWYQVDGGDSDVSTFFYYMGIAAKKASPHYRKPLPLLTPEYILGISTFALRYFEELFSRLRCPFILVLDNYHEAEPDSQFHEVVTKAFSVMPDMINWVLISRKPPPEQYVRLRAYGQMSFVSGDDLYFTVDESREFFKAKGLKEINDETLLKICEKTSGWAAGLTLVTETQKKSGINYQLLEERSPKEIFSYFAQEIFNRADETIQAFLLKTAFLSKITAKIGMELTDVANAEQILTDLYENNYFTVCHTLEQIPVYQYHPLFRSFLLERAKESLSFEEISVVRKNAARLVEKSGDIEQASELYTAENSWDELIRLILSNAKALISQGRGKTLRNWILSIPEEIRAWTPWLLYWLGVCQMPFSPAESRKHFEESFRLFNEQNDTVGTLLSWAAVVDSIILEWDDFTILDPWIEWLDHRMKHGTSFPSPEVEASVASSMVGALEWRRPQHPDIKKWLERAISLSLKISDVNLCLRTCVHAITYYSWIGDINNCSVVAEEMKRKIQTSKTSPHILLTWKFTESIMYSWSALTQSKSRQAVLEGLEIARQSGVHILDNILFAHGVYSSFYVGDIVQAGEFLKKVETTLDSKRRNSVAQYHLLAAWYYLLTGNISYASVQAEKAVRLVVETGTPFPEILCRFAMAQVLNHEGKRDEAMEQLTISKDIAGKMNTSLLKYVSLLTEAQFAMDKDDEAQCLESIRKAMALGKEQEYFTMVFFWLPHVWSKLCAKALENGIETDYVKDLIRKLNLFPHAPSLEIESWPYPLKIYTLGRFGVIKDEKPLKFSGKVQQKPLFLLKAILSFGGREVSEEQLSDALWPDAAGDVAHISFKTNLHRLRQLIGHEEAVQLKERRITLDHRYMWVDAWAFQRAEGKAGKIYKQLEEGEIKKQDRDEFEKEMIRLSEKAVDLYKGDFLTGDSMEPWTVHTREKLKDKFIQLILKLCRYYERAGQWEKAITYCQRGLEIDDISEEFYQRLMRCYQKIGRSADAVAVYNRCCKTLAAVIGVEPSQKTAAIYKSICSADRKT